MSNHTMTKTSTFVVEGDRFSFPIDMLRYDSAWPHSQENVATIESILRCRSSPEPPVQITLECAHKRPTVERRATFGSRVVEIDANDHGEHDANAVAEPRRSFGHILPTPARRPNSPSGEKRRKSRYKEYKRETAIDTAGDRSGQSKRL